MNYNKTIEWLFSQLPIYQLVGANAYKKDLTNTILLANHLNNPQNKIKSIHVAGTNGKGSTSSMIASILQEAGYKVGLYTSPHLKDFRERIKINGKCISKKFVVKFVEKNKSFFEQHSLSFFEMTVGLAFNYFENKNVDVALIEVGMGGRLDSTNIIKPLVSVITNIGLDHTAFLGDTLEKIAFEKAGIIKKEIPVIIGEYSNETKSVFIEKSKKENASLVFASDLDFADYDSDLKGIYQKKNIKSVLAAITELKKHFKIKEENIILGLKNVVANTGLLGRWQQLGSKPKIIADCAHNKHGIDQVLRHLSTEKFENLHVVLGFVNDKNVFDILSLFPKDAYYYFCKPNVPRGLEVEKVLEVAINLDLHFLTFNSVAEALVAAKKVAKKQDLIYCGGSTFVVAEIV